MSIIAAMFSGFFRGLMGLSKVGMWVFLIIIPFLIVSRAYQHSTWAINSLMGHEMGPGRYQIIEHFRKHSDWTDPRFYSPRGQDTYVVLTVENRLSYSVMATFSCFVYDPQWGDQHTYFYIEAKPGRHRYAEEINIPVSGHSAQCNMSAAQTVHDWWKPIPRDTSSDT